MPIEPANVVAYTQETPQHVATTIMFEDPYSWVVLCEGGCRKQIRMAKYTYVQTDFSQLVTNPNDATYRRIDYTYPQGILCTGCGPNGDNWHGWPWSHFTYGKLASTLGLHTLVQQQRFVRWLGRPEDDIYELVTVEEAAAVRARYELGSFDLFLG